MTPCPPGWNTVTASIATACEPWSASGPDTCSADQAHFVGEADCTLVGDPCPLGDWPDTLPTDRPLLFVKSGAPPNGTGTQLSPFDSVNTAANIAAPGTIIVLASGRYEEAISLTREVTLWGSCVLGTLLSSPASGWSFMEPIVRTTSSVTIRNLRIGESFQPAIVAEGDGTILDLRDLVVADAGSGISALSGTHLTARSIVVRDLRGRKDQGGGEGLVIEATAAISRSVIAHARRYGIDVMGESASLQLDSVAVRATSPSQGLFGSGLYLSSGAAVQVVRSVFEENHDISILVLDPDTHLRIEESLIRATHEGSIAPSGIGLLVGFGATASVARTLMATNRGPSIQAQEGRISIEDSLVRDTAINASQGSIMHLERCLLYRNSPHGMMVLDEATQADLVDLSVVNAEGPGLWVVGGAALNGERLLFDKNEGEGLGVTGNGTNANLLDLTVRETESESLGDGLLVLDLAEVTVQRGQFQRNEGGSITVENASLHLEDINVTDTRMTETGGVGLWALESNVTVTRARFARNELMGIRAGNTPLTLTDITIEESQSGVQSDHLGAGIWLFNGARAEAHRVTLERNRNFGILLFLGATGSFSDLVVRDTRSREIDGQQGFGMLVEPSSSATVQRALFERNTDEGVMVIGPNAHLHMEDVAVLDTQSSDAVYVLPEGRLEQLGGRGLGLYAAATASVSRAHFSSNREVSVIAFGEGTRLDMEQVLIEDSLPRDCYQGICSENAAGFGLGAVDQAAVSVQHFILARAHLCGVFIATQGVINLRSGEVSSAPIGVCMQTDVDPAALSEDVDFRGNGVNLTSTKLPIPFVDESPL